MRIWVAGWRQVSLIDVLGAPASVAWVCGCNLRCPFCHNWRIADGIDPACRWLEVGDVVEALRPAFLLGLVEFVQVSGGEPLLQLRAVAELLRCCRELGVAPSIDTNLTLPDALQSLLDEVVPRHVATDVKAPPGIAYGLPRAEAEATWSRFLESLRILARARGVEILELRLLELPPRWRSAEVEREIRERLGEVMDALRGFRGRVVQRRIRLLGPPHADVRDPRFFA